MRTLIAAASLTALLAGLCGCGSDDPPPPKEKRAPMAVEDTVFGDMIETQDRARSVEDTNFEHKRQMDEAIDDQSGR
jgi:hypothetical protein